MMSMQELFYGDNEPTWIMHSYQETPRVYQEQAPRRYSQNVAPRYRAQYHRTEGGAASPSRVHENVPQYAETRYMPRGGEPRYMSSVVYLKVPMCCTKCEEKVKEALLEMEGVEVVKTDQYKQRVIVAGAVDPLRVLKRVKKIKKRSELMSHEPYYKASAHTDSALINACSHRPELSQVHRQQLPSTTAYVQEFYNTPPATYAGPSSYRHY